MTKKELLNKKIKILEKVVENKDNPIKVLINEQEKNKEILNNDIINIRKK